MKKVLILNGSPRKNGNTNAMLQEAAKGAQSTGAQVEFLHLYDYKFTGCLSCFACKTIDDKFLGCCALQDDLTPILEKIVQSDTIIFGTPVYLFNISSALRALFERLVFMNCSYDHESPEHYSIFPRKINIGMIYTMNVSEAEMTDFNFTQQIQQNEFFLKFFNGHVQSLAANDTYQFNDYSKYHTKAIDVTRKEKVRATQFPLDIQKAFDLGKRLVKMN